MGITEGRFCYYSTMKHGRRNEINSEWADNELQRHSAVVRRIMTSEKGGMAPEIAIYTLVEGY